MKKKGIHAMSILKQRLLPSGAGRVVIEYLVITLGVVIFDLALDWFLVPNQIAAGGITGLSVVLSARLGWPVGITYLLLNVPLLLVGFRSLGGREFILRTVYATVLIGTLVDPLAQVAKPLTHDHILAALYGGGLAGGAVGLIYHWRGSTAGGDIIALLLKRFARMKLGTAQLATDGLIILTVGLCLNLQLALYALVCMYIKSKVVEGMLKALKAKNLSLIRRPTGLIGPPPAATSRSSGSLVVAYQDPGALNHPSDGSALQPPHSPSASQIFSGLVLPYTSLEPEEIGGQRVHQPRS
jgi:hypothetical protein